MIRWWKLTYCKFREMKSMMLICYLELFTLFWSAHSNNMVRYHFCNKLLLNTGTRKSSRANFGLGISGVDTLSVRQRANNFRCSGMLWTLRHTNRKQKNRTIGKSQFVSSLRELQSALFSVLSRVAHWRLVLIIIFFIFF